MPAGGSHGHGPRVGTAGWSIPRESAAAFPGEDQHLHRYARVLSCAEINSSFHRSHKASVYERWASSTPPGFRFSAKLPRTISHDSGLVGTKALLARFLDEVAGLGEKLAVLLVQFPPSLAFDAGVVVPFFSDLRRRCTKALVCEPRHASWFDAPAEATLIECRVGRVAADPARVAAAAVPGGWLGPSDDGREAVVYHRWHGSPQVYRSRYEPSWLRARAEDLARWPQGTDRWCIFDNTASGAALPNALEMHTAMDAAAWIRAAGAP